MTAAIGIEIATAGKAQTSGLTATGASTSVTADSFRSSWESLLASLGCGLDGASGKQSGTDAAPTVSGASPTEKADTTSVTGLSQSVAAALLDSAGKSQGTGTVVAAVTATQTALQTPSLATTTAQKTTTAKTPVLGTCSDTHSNTKSAKSEAASTGASDQVAVVPDTTLQPVLGFAQDAAFAPASGTTAAPVSATNIPASDATPAISTSLSDTANPVGVSGLQGKASSAFAAGLQNELAESGDTTSNGSAAEGALNNSGLRDSAQATVASSSITATRSSQGSANSGLLGATADQSPAPAVTTSVSGGNEAHSTGKSEATPAPTAMSSASGYQSQSLDSSNNLAQSGGTEKLAVPASSDGLHVSALTADTAASQSSQTSASSSVGKKAGVTNTGRTSEQVTSRSTQQTGTLDSTQHQNLSTAAQPVLAVQDGTGMVRDASGWSGANGTAGHAVRESVASATSSDGSGSSETFSALDAGSTSSTSTWTHAGTQHAEAGFQDPALGWVGVRADSSGGSIHASLVAGSADAAQTLSGHLAGLNAYLADQHATVSAVTVAASEDRSASYSMDQSMNQGTGQDGGRGQQPVPAASVPAFASTAPVVSVAGTEVSTLVSSPGDSHISLMA